MSADVRRSVDPLHRVLLCACGSVAAMATPVLARWLVERLAPCDVRVCATEAGRRMIDLGVADGLPWDGRLASTWSTAVNTTPSPDHLTLADWADVILVAPATANTMGHVAHGLAPNLLTTVLLAASCPVVYAPAMNSVMWTGPAVQRNVATLRHDGALVLEPREGVSVSVGRTEFGSMANPIPTVESLLERSQVA